MNPPLQTPMHVNGVLTPTWMEFFLQSGQPGPPGPPGPSGTVGTITAITYAASITPAVGGGVSWQIWECDLTGPVTVNDPTGGSAGVRFTLRLKQDGTGGRTVAWGPMWAIPSTWQPSGVPNKFMIVEGYFFDASNIRITNLQAEL